MFQIDRVAQMAMRLRRLWILLFLLAMGYIAVLKVADRFSNPNEVGNGTTSPKPSPARELPGRVAPQIRR